MINNETKKDLTKDLVTNIDNIGSVLTKLERVDFLLNELIEDYKYPEEDEPDISKFSSNITKENLSEKKPTMSWVLAYDRVLKFIEIAEECTSNCKAEIEHISNNLNTTLDTLKNTTSEEAV